MTTGNIERNVLNTIVGPYGPITGGRYSYKSWSGGDSIPKGKKLYTKKFWLEDRVKTKYYFDRRRGKYYTISKTIKVVRWNRTAVAKPRPTVLAPNYYTCNIAEINDPLVATYSNYRPNATLIMANNAWWNGGVGFTVGIDSRDEYRLLGKLRESLAGSEFNLGVFLAEASPALGMIFNAATRIDRALRKFQRFDYAGAARALIDGPVKKKSTFSSKKSASNNWLELQYGWLPLLKDAEAGAQFLAHMSSVPLKRRVVSRIRKSVTGELMPDSTAFTRTGDEVHLLQIVSYIEEVDTVKLSGLSDPLSIVWERIPYSFVVDWFLPIGNFLQSRALAQAVKGTFVRTYTKRLKSTGQTIRASYLQSLGPETALTVQNIGALGAASYRLVQMERTVLSGLSAPPPAVRKLGDAMSWRRTANAVALLAQRFK